MKTSYSIVWFVWLIVFCFYFVCSTGSGDIDTSTVAKADSDGCIRGASGLLRACEVLFSYAFYYFLFWIDGAFSILGTSLVVNPAWKNPTGEWHVGSKMVYQLFTENLTSRLKVIILHIYKSWVAFFALLVLAKTLTILFAHAER